MLVGRVDGADLLVSDYQKLDEYIMHLLTDLYGREDQVPDKYFTKKAYEDWCNKHH